jgi:DNA-directed RNA polymerase subunit K/omega
MATNPSIITRNVAELADIAGGNTYEAVAIISKRARQIALKSKEELNNKLSDFASSVDNLEEIFENREQIEISKFYERLPKPTSLAIDEFIENKFTYTLPSDDKDAE